MSWQERKPEGVGEVRLTEDGFTSSVTISHDEDGFVARECPACEGPFKIRGDDYQALPENPVLTCPYCGHQQDHSHFLSSAQAERARAALHGLAEQYVHDLVNKTFGQRFGGASRPSRSGQFVSVEWSYRPGSPPPIKALPEIEEDPIRRVVVCSACGTHHALYSASAFCPVCGPRPAAEKVVETIAGARAALAVEDSIEHEEREKLRAAGVFERFAVDALESVVSLFEMFAREQFTQRVADASRLTRGRGNIFQRLDDSAALFAERTGLDLPALAGRDRWQRLKRAFAQRHVLTHNGGLVDERFLDQVPDTTLVLGQRVIVRRTDAAEALDDLEVVVSAVSEV